MTTVSPAYEAADSGPYPFGLDVDGPQAQNRLSVFLRLIFAIPHFIALALIGIAAYVITIIAWFVILFTGKYPGGMVNFTTGALRWGIRAYGYTFLLTDKYPPFSLDDDAAYPIRVSANPQLDGRNRLTVFFRVIMIIPHAIVLGIINYVAELLGFVAWLIALFTGSVPAGLHNFLAGWLRWSTRYYAYALLLTDEYPPFSLS
ncbi:MAG: DUF4389 domain-containing protein [Anaerolinea sp.]|nr:DUF4389 domain-containing protein [Anaerolinea sp.]